VAKGLIKETVKEAGRQVRQSVERQRDLQPERSEEVPVCDADSGRPRKKIADLAFTIKQCRGLPGCPTICFAVCCIVLQCAAVCCSVLQFCSVLQCAAMCCSVLQYMKSLGHFYRVDFEPSSPCARQSHSALLLNKAVQAAPRRAIDGSSRL